MKYNPLLVATPLVATLVACTSDTNFDFAASEQNRANQVAAASAPQALYNPDPTAAVLPFPNNLFFLGSTDGTLNIPIAASANQELSNPQVALNQMDGFSTTSPLSTAVSESLNPASLVVGSTIRIFEVTTQQAIAVTGIVGELSNPSQMVAQEINNNLLLVPTVPLKPKTDYLVVLTNGIQDNDGNGLEQSFVYSLLAGDTVLTDPSLEALRGATGSHILAAQGAGITAETVALTWVFRTQSTRDVLQAASDQTAAGNLTLSNSQQTTAAAGAAGKADIYLGAMTLPYYQTAVGEDLNPIPALNSFWKNASGGVVGSIGESRGFEYAPVATSVETIPVIMSVPNATSASTGAMPAGGWPVTIFQHGITGNRTQMLAIADAMADAGRVVIAIDMPMHGLTDPTNPFHANNTTFGERERTFNIDAEGGAADGEIDSSGTHFYNIQNLANARDNLRQAVTDLLALTASVGGVQAGDVRLNAGNMNFVGHSLGGIVGTTMLSYTSNFQTATIAMSGGGIAQLLANSERFGPTINTGLANVGIETGSAEYNRFLIATQTMIDSGDPINHAAMLASSGTTSVHMIEVVDDNVVPNSVATAPLSGTDPLARILGLTQVDATTTSGNALVKFSAGDHGSILNPAASATATVEMQTQTATFANTQGTVLPITDSSVIKAVE